MRCWTETSPLKDDCYWWGSSVTSVKIEHRISSVNTESYHKNRQNEKDEYSEESCFDGGRYSPIICQYNPSITNLICRERHDYSASSYYHNIFMIKMKMWKMTCMVFRIHQQQEPRVRHHQRNRKRSRMSWQRRSYHQQMPYRCGNCRDLSICKFQSLYRYISY